MKKNWPHLALLFFTIAVLIYSSIVYSGVKQSYEHMKQQYASMGIRPVEPDLIRDVDTVLVHNGDGDLLYREFFWHIGNSAGSPPDSITIDPVKKTNISIDTTYSIGFDDKNNIVHIEYRVFYTKDATLPDSAHATILEIIVEAKDLYTIKELIEREL